MDQTQKQAQELRLMALKGYTVAFENTEKLATLLGISSAEARKQVENLVKDLSRPLDGEPSKWPTH